MISIIYLCPAINKPTGGIKVILRHSQIINELERDDVCSAVHFPEDPAFDVTWFDHKACIKRDATFNRNEDLVVVPEFWALKYGEKLRSKNIKYAIFVQNGYMLFHGSDIHTLEQLRLVYTSASLILSISRDTTKCVRLAFPDSVLEVNELSCGIDQKVFDAKRDKSNIISYMPRKLPEHSSNVISFLHLQKLEGWSIVPIDNMGEKEVAATLARSKIFLSFSEREGLGLPPIEAALSGNLVVGYTGEGGKEYWSPDIFTEIAAGNILDFVAITVQRAKKISETSFDHRRDPAFVSGMTKLATMYSLENEKNKLSDLVGNCCLKTVGVKNSKKDCVELTTSAEKYFFALSKFSHSHSFIRLLVRAVTKMFS